MLCYKGKFLSQLLIIFFTRISIRKKSNKKTCSIVCILRNIQKMPENFILSKASIITHKSLYFSFCFVHKEDFFLKMINYLAILANKNTKRGRLIFFIYLPSFHDPVYLSYLLNFFYRITFDKYQIGPIACLDSAG